MPIAKPLHLRLFLEGIEIPVVSAQVQIGLNSPAVASIQVVPLDEAMSLKPRTMVHLFFLDSELKKTQTGVSPVSGYRLLFAGEVVGFSMVRTAQSRALVLQCLDFSSYWDACHATSIDWGPNGNAFYNDAAMYGSTTVLFDNIANHQPEKLVSWLNDTPKTPGLTAIGGLAGGVIRMLEAMGGIPGHERGVNDFFSVAQLRCKILEQIAAEENDRTAARLLARGVFDEWLKNGLQSVGLQVTFRDMMKLLFQYIYYDMVPNPAAKYQPFQEGKTTSLDGSKISIKSSPMISASVARLKATRKNLIRMINSSDSVAIKRQVKFSIDEIKKEESIFRGVKSSDCLRGAGMLAVAHAALSAKVDLAQPQDYGIEEAVKRIEEAEKVIFSSRNTIISRETSSTSASNDRLLAHILRPDCFFVPPPRCNVLFPEDYVQFSYDRVFTSEVTRAQLLLYSELINPGGGDRMFASSVVSPFLSADANNMIKGAGSQGYRSLMPHELHTGIIPRTEWLSNTVAFDGKPNQEAQDKKKGARLGWMRRASMFHFFKGRYASRQASVTGRFNPRIVCGFPGLIITKPFIVKGVDPSDTSLLAKVQTKAQEMGGPVHLIGMINSVAHSISQDGGTTSISMHHVRQHMGVDDELLYILSRKQNKKKVILKIPLSADTEDEKLLKLMADLSPQSTAPRRGKGGTSATAFKSSKATVYEIVDGVRTEKEETFLIPQRKQKSSIPQPGKLTVSGSIPGVEGDFDVPALPTKLVRGAKGLHGKVLGVSVEDDSLVRKKYGLVFSSMVLYEELEVEITTEVPVEENIRPDWFSSNYSNLSIGPNIYDKFFGCGSIVDDLAVEALGSSTINIPLGTTPDDEVTAPPDKGLDKIVDEVQAGETLKSKVTIEKAANMIGFLYGSVKSQGMDVDQFINNFTARPIATLEEVLAPETNLTISGDKVTGVEGPLGFHTLAVHQTTVEAGNLTGLINDPQLKVPRIRSTGSSKPIPPGYDVRLEKRDRVLKYYEALKRGPAFIG